MRPTALLASLALVSFPAPGLGQDLPPLRPGEGLVARVDLDGALTLEEDDVVRLALVRARRDGDAREGLFGRGWRTWLDARPGEQPGTRFDAQGRPVARGGLRAAWSADRVRVWAPDGAAVDLLLARGRVARARGHLVDLRYDYSAAGELTSVHAGEARARAYVVVDGRVAAVDGRAGRLLACARDARGRVERLESPVGARRYRWWDTGGALETDEGGRWTWRRGEGVEHTWGLGADGLAGADGRAVARATATGLAVDTPWGTFEVTRDAAGRAQEVRGPFGQVTFTRDRTGRRVRVARSNGVTTALSWEGDAAPTVTHTGPRGPLVVAPVVPADGDDEALDGRVERAGALEWWTVDAAGRLVAAGDLRLRHDAAGRVVEVEGPPGEGGPAWAVRYAWDAAGRLARAERRGPGASVVSWVHDDQGRPAWRADEAGLARVVAPWLVRATIARGDVRVDVLDPDDPHGAPPLAVRVGGAWLFLLDDGRGTVGVYADGRGAPAARAAFSARGEVLVDPERGLPLFWAGREVDRGVGLALVDGRPYAPWLGRFLAPDPTRAGGRAYASDGLAGALQQR